MLDKTAAPEALERTESDEGQEVENFDLPVEGRRGLLHRFAPQRLVSRIVLLNLLGLVILVTGILYFNQFRQGLIDARVQSLTTQAQIIAAAIAGSATADTGSIVINPDSLEDTSDPYAPDADQLGNLDFPINPETTGPCCAACLPTQLSADGLSTPKAISSSTAGFSMAAATSSSRIFRRAMPSARNIIVRWWNAAL